jgi:hypothetical protein
LLTPDSPITAVTAFAAAAAGAIVPCTVARRLSLRCEASLMHFVAIREVRLDPATDDLRVVPDVPTSRDYDGVYRAAMSARWDLATHEFYVVDFIGRTPLASYRQIVGAVANEYGARLTPTAATVWTHVPEGLREAIVAWDAQGVMTA